jgi:hypothetical protein
LLSLLLLGLLSTLGLFFFFDGVGVGVGLIDGRTRSRLRSSLRCWVNPLVTLGAIEVLLAGTGAGYAICAGPPGQLAAATAVPTTPIKATGTTSRTTRTASGGRKALRGRGRATYPPLPRAK